LPEAVDHLVVIDRLRLEPDPGLLQRPGQRGPQFVGAQRREPPYVEPRGVLGLHTGMSTRCLEQPAGGLFTAGRDQEQRLA
jgi:hypothetical protein